MKTIALLLGAYTQHINCIKSMTQLKVNEGIQSNKHTDIGKILHIFISPVTIFSMTRALARPYISFLFFFILLWSLYVYGKSNCINNYSLHCLLHCSIGSLSSEKDIRSVFSTMLPSVYGKAYTIEKNTFSNSEFILLFLGGSHLRTFCKLLSLKMKPSMNILFFFFFFLYFSMVDC